MIGSGIYSYEFTTTVEWDCPVCNEEHREDVGVDVDDFGHATYEQVCRRGDVHYSHVADYEVQP